MKIFDTIDEEPCIMPGNRSITVHINLLGRQINVNNLKVTTLKSDELQILIANISCKITGYTIYDHAYNVLKTQKLDVVMDKGESVAIDLRD